MEPRSEGPRDWQNVFVITRFRCIEEHFHTFCYPYWGEKHRCYTEDFVIQLR